MEQQYENSEGRPMNICERELVEAGYKILLPTDVDEEGFTVMTVFAEVHPDSINFAKKEIKDILTSFTYYPEQIRIEHSKGNDSRVLNVGFILKPELMSFIKSKNYIKEFNEAQKDKKYFLPTKWDQPSEFIPNIKSSKPGELEFSPNDSKILKQPKKPEDNSQSFPMETITLNEVKDMVSEAILEYMNVDTISTEPLRLLPEQKAEIKQKIEEGCKRQGIMSISFHDDFDKNESTVNLLIDPTNRNNWIALKEEQIYKVPYSCKKALYDYASEVWKNNIK